MRIHVASIGQKRTSADALVLLCWQDEPLRASVSAARLASAWARRSSFGARPSEIAWCPTWGQLPVPHLILAGLGRRDRFHPGVLRRAMGAMVRQAARAGLKTLAVQFDLPWSDIQLSDQHAVHLAALGCCEGAYRFSRFKKSPIAPPAQIHLAVAHTKNMVALRRAARDAALIGETINRTREIANLPGNEAPPRAIAAYARALARRSGLQVQVWDRRRLSREGCRAHLAVAQGSRAEPCLIVLRYPGRKRGRKPVVLVGKTITFDTGGISIKPAKSMEWMKYDKSGGMTVLAVMELVGRLLRPDYPVVGMLAAAENMPGGGATRPGDIVTSRSGKTIEILNTDAEGRLVLADALSVAQDLKPACIVDFATLTGAAVTAVGHVVAPVLANDQRLGDFLLAAGRNSGDRLWPLPLFDEYADMLLSTFADIKNIGDGTAGAIAGGMFLKAFVSDNIPWAHVDLTTAWEEKEQAHGPAGATLFGTALICDWLRQGGPSVTRP